MRFSVRYAVCGENRDRAKGLDQRATIAEAFLSAAVEPAGWLPALGQLAAATGSNHAQMIGFGPDYRVGFNWVNDPPPGLHAAFDGSEGGSPAVNFRTAANLAYPEHAVIHEAHYETVRPTLIAEDYLDLCHDHDIPYGCQTNLRQDGRGLLGLALLRSRRNAPTTPEQRATFHALREDVARAAALQVALEGQGHRLVAYAFEAMSVACLVLDRAMRVQALSAPAERMLGESNALRLSDGRVAAIDDAGDRRLALAQRAILEGAAAQHVVLSKALSVRIHRLPKREWSMGFAPFAILIVRQVSKVAPGGAAVLRDTYRLTATEADIAVRLRAGQTRAAICRTRGIGPETLRSHLRAIFSKLDVHRETEAIHLLHIILD